MKKMKTVAITIDDELIEIVNSKAKKLNLETYSFSALVRYFLRLGVKK